MHNHIAHNSIPAPDTAAWNWRSIQDRITYAIAAIAATLVTAIFAWIIIDLLTQGAPRLSLAFLTTAPTDAGRAGGIAPIITSTVLILSICLATSIPIGLGTAILLAEFTPSESRFTKLIRRSLDVLAGVPSIVFGLFGNAIFCIYLGMGFSILSGGLTLACMVLPIFIRSAEQGFRAVPDDHRRAAAALGFTKTKTITHILMPAAMPGLLVGLVLGVGRAIAETAALLFTSGYVDRLPASLFDSGRALSVHIYDLAMNVPGGESNACATALVLVVILLTINRLAIFVSDHYITNNHQPE